jgi:hypothetical protein
MGKERGVIPELRARFNATYKPEKYHTMRTRLDERSGAKIEFRVAETPVFVPRALLDQIAEAGQSLAFGLLADEDYLQAAHRAIPAGFCVAGETAHPHFLTADFALVRGQDGHLSPRLVEIQAFPSVFAYQAVLCESYRACYELPEKLGCFLSDLDEEAYWKFLASTIVAGHDPKTVVLTEVDPLHQKTLPDFTITAQRLGIAVVDISTLEAIGRKLHYRDKQGRLVPIERIYNRSIADELMARKIQLPFDLSRSWDVEWAGHPNWYFLISKFSVPWLCSVPENGFLVPPAVFLSEFLAGSGRDKLAAAGASLPSDSRPDAVYGDLLLKPLFSFAGKGIQFAPTQAELEAIPAESRGGYLLQQRMRFEHTIETPHGLTQAEFRILYIWPDGGNLTPVLSLVRLGRGKMMGVDHNKNLQWVGASAAFFPQD